MKLDKKKHIVLLTPGFPMDENDSVCIPSLQVFVKELAKNKAVCVSVVALHYPTKKEVYSWHGVKVYPIGALNNKFPFRLNSWRKCLQIIKKINKNNPIDKIHSFWLTDVALVGKIASKRFKTPHFITLMGQDVYANNKYVKLVKPSANQLVFLSNNQAQLFKNNFGFKANRITPWGTSVNQIEGREAKRIIDILAVGSLTELKNFKLLVEIAPELLKQKSDFSIKIIGKGPEKESLQTLINELKLNHCIELLGELPNEKVLEFMSKAKVLVHPSKYESFGYVFSEALSQGMKIVSFNVGAAQHSDYWKVVEQKNDFAPAILGLFHSESNIAPAVFDIKDTVKEYLSLWS